jgi:tetratricopeptide (TPR) repeat protein
VTILAELKYARGDTNDAEKMFQMALDCNMKTVGLHDLATIRILERIGELQLSQHAYKKAERAYRDALRGYEEVCGANSGPVLQMLHQLGICLYRGGQVIDGRETLLKAYTGRQKLLGSNHLDTALSLHELGKVYHKESHWRHKPDVEETRRKAQAALDVRERDIKRPFAKLTKSVRVPWQTSSGCLEKIMPPPSLLRSTWPTTSSR